MTNTAGVIGLGEIGSGVALCLARAGMLTAVYDTRKDAADGLDGVPALSASPAAVARQCDTIVVAVVTAQQTIDVLSGPEGILAAARPGLGVILVATVSLDDLARIRSLTDAAGVALIDSGVVGGLKARENGLVCLVGAEDDALARARPVFEGFARSVAHLGGPGAGMTGKIAFNAMFLGILKAGREGATLAAAAGVDVGALTAVVADRLMAVGGPMRFVSQPGDPATDPEEARRRDALCAVAAKDLDAALTLGRSKGVALPLVELARRTIREIVGALPESGTTH